MVGWHFPFSPAEISGIQSHVPGRLSHYTTAFDLLAVVLWRCHAAVLGYAAHQRVWLMFTSNAHRSRKHDPPIPTEYYGCVVAFPSWRPPPATRAGTTASPTWSGWCAGRHD
jgi:hypothetical protein